MPPRLCRVLLPDAWQQCAQVKKGLGIELICMGDGTVVEFRGLEQVYMLSFHARVQPIPGRSSCAFFLFHVSASYMEEADSRVR
jgi:hypothetical protein